MEATLGAQIEIPLAGYKIRVEPGTQSGKIPRLAGRLPSVDSYGKGDLLVNLNVWTLQELSSEERYLEKWRRPHF